MSDLWIFLTVPVITGLVGWSTNWAAVKMIFYPVDFRGIGRLGWQGIIYRSAPVLAAGVGDMVEKQLMSREDMVARLDADTIKRFVDTRMERDGKDLMALCGTTAAPSLWNALAPSAREGLLSQARREVAGLVGELALALRDRMDRLLDIKELVVHSLSGKNAGVLAKLMKQVAARELKFIEYYGGVFGLLIGIVEMVAWSIFQVWWVMPLVGAAVGLITNYLAILMIFKPQQPTRYFGLVTYQGMFAKRQNDIARDYGQTTADHVLSPSNLIDLMARGQGRTELEAIWKEFGESRVEALRTRAGDAFPAPLNEEMLDRLGKTMSEEMHVRGPELRKEFEDFLYHRLDIAKTIEGRLRDLTKDEFEGLLRPLFEQDEWILIAVGGVLGALVGSLQALVVLSLS